MAFRPDPDTTALPERHADLRLDASIAKSTRRKKRLPLIAIVVALAAALVAVGLVRFDSYWKHRFDPLINRHASFYNLDAALVWSVIYEETYFRPWVRGDAGEVGLMQVTPAVAREWAAETGLPDFERRAERDPEGLLRDPERNIQIGCWYLEKLAKRYRDEPAQLAMTLAAYNAGPSRVSEWRRAAEGDGRDAKIAEASFVEHIGIASTRAYVRSILERHRARKSARGAAGGR